MKRILGLLFSAALLAGPPVVRIDKPMAPPEWALAERALLKAYAEAAAEFAAKYVDERGYFKCIERWGGNDGPDDVMETFNNWTLLHSLGASDTVLELYRKIWEGHLRQFTAAKAPSTQAAKEGMFYKEFVTAFDWEHTGEGLAAFHHYALSAPRDAEYVRRVRRFAEFYTGAPNYDSRHKIIRSLLHGSRGPILTPATVFDWGGEAVEGHPERHDRYRAAGNVRGDHPLNLGTCSLGFNAYALTGENKYRDWVLEYAGAWKDRILANGGNIPTNIGLDGTIGGEWGGKWWGGTFGWNFDPAVSGRNYYMRGARTGLGEALLLTGDMSFAEPLRRQLANLYAARRMENGRVLMPQKYGERGWYGFTGNQYFEVQRDLYLWSMNPADLANLAGDPWIRYLRGNDAGYPAKALATDFERLRRRVEGMRADESTGDTRPSDGAQRFNPVATETLVNLMLGGNDPGASGNVLHARLRYFDARMRRAGLPEDVAALVDSIDADSVRVTLVNTSPVNARELVVQMGAFAEHNALSVETAGKRIPVDGSHFTVRLAPGAGQTLTIAMKRYANPPTAAFPWDR
ncbi:MAG: hypothetical protein JNM66_08890 [Bryobacterales bacterium]|nr:hypothetical protein [Bryobacterales bacterium]